MLTGLHGAASASDLMKLRCCPQKWSSKTTQLSRSSPGIFSERLTFQNTLLLSPLCSYFIFHILQNSENSELYYPGWRRFLAQLVKQNCFTAIQVYELLHVMVAHVLKLSSKRGKKSYVQTYGTVLQIVVPLHLMLNHRHRRYKASIMLQKSGSPWSKYGGIQSREQMLSESWFELSISIML
jgi:hypothetical protein